MTPRKRRATTRNASNDEARARIAIHLQRAVVDLKAAELALERLSTYPGDEREKDSTHIHKVCRNLKVIHNRYSHIKQS